MNLRVVGINVRFLQFKDRVMIINTDGKIPIKSWCNNLENGAMEQAKNLSNLPFAFKHIALMPDTHQGYGMPIGGVMATTNVIVPNAVGVDIGCGMCAIKSSLNDITESELKTVLSGIREIPVGFNSHKEDQWWPGLESIPDISVVKSEIQKAKRQLGTLGGGNHFIEIQRGSDGHIWIMIHSGSRAFGYAIAKEYNSIAQGLCKKWYSNIPNFRGEDGLAFLPINSQEGAEYIEAMNYALDFARENRFHMLEHIKEKFILEFHNIKFDEAINIHHNYAKLENHFGKNVWVHRKGATSAYEHQLGIIPGSQGSKSYIVSGKGNIQSFKSCSHGAGRKMGRKEAQRTLSLEAELKILNDKGVLHALRGQKDLDEAPSAYKDIDIVINEQIDLINIKVELEPLAVVKG